MHISLRDLVSSIMLKEKRIVVGCAYVYEIGKELQKKLGTTVLVEYENEKFKCFEKRNPEFKIESGNIRLKPKYDLNWISKNVNLNMAVEAMEALGLLDDENEILN